MTGPDDRIASEASNRPVQPLYRVVCSAGPDQAVNVFEGAWEECVGWARGFTRAYHLAGVEADVWVERVEELVL